MQQIILLHGALGASDQLESLSNLLTKKSIQTFLLSFSGHGKMPFASEFGIEFFASELKSLVEKNGLSKPHVFGYSMGGYTALYLAKREPGLLGRIITLGTKFRWSREIADKEIENLDAKLIEEKVPKFAAALKKRHGEDWIRLLQMTAEMMKGLGEKNVLEHQDFFDIKNKVLIGIGDKDQMVTLEETLEVYRSLPDANMYMLPGSKHPIEAANAEILAVLIEDFIVEKLV